MKATNESKYNLVDYGNFFSPVLPKVFEGVKTD